jgi:hypothetical protein
MMAGDVEAHKCPKCGKSEWRGFSGGQAQQPATAKRILVVEANSGLYLVALLKVAILVIGAVLLGEVLAGWMLAQD